MALQIYTPNVGPQLRFAGAQALSHGISSGMQQGLGSLIDGLAKRKEETHRLVKNAKSADAMAKNNPDLLGRTPYSYEEFQTLGAQDKVDTMQSAIAGLEIEKQMLATDALRRQSKNASAMPGLLEALTQTGQAEATTPEPFSFESFMGMAPRGGPPTPLSNAEYDRRTTSDSLTRLADAISRSGAEPTPRELIELADVFASMQPANQNGLPMGATMEVPGTGKYVGMGRGAVPRFIEDKAAERRAPNLPWTLSDDDQEYMKGLRQVQDPEVRDLIIELRRKYLLSKGELNPAHMLMLRMLSGQTGGTEATEGGEPFSPTWQKFLEQRGGTDE